ncbi:MAG: ATP-binding cassette domain-containing protein [Deltaproteobacteria bacterium]|nr:MAG: ATP-binding cassette domain-containing protein [Deltaproteobacteria bacterium]
MLQNSIRGFSKKRPVTSSDDTLFSLEDVSVTFGNLKALESVSLDIHQGEILFVTGSSGAGKTTLLRLLAEQLKPDSGKILLPKDLIGVRLFISQVFQDLKFLMNKTCEENLFHSFDKKVYKNKKIFLGEMNDLCKILGITDRLHLKMEQANGGLKQKVALIRALLAKPEVIILDEPTGSLDVDNARKIYEVLSYYNMKKKLTIIWASHNRELVKEFTGRIIHLDSGKLVYTGHACFI